MLRSTLMISAAALAFAACTDNTDMDTAAEGVVTPDTTATSPEGATVPGAAGQPDMAAMQEEAQTFVNALGQANLAEIRTSEMALERAKSAEVKALAQKIIDDHSAAGERLKTLAGAQGLMAPPTTLDDFHMRRVNDLTETDGDADFDADYINLQVDAHDDAIGLVEGYVGDADAMPELRSFGTELLGTLRAHRSEAETVRSAMQSAGN